MAADCLNDGKRERSCEDCGHTEESTIKALGHYYSGEFIVDKPATCTSAGSKWNYCTRCEAKGEKITIEPVGHEYTEWKSVKIADCVNEGEKEHSCKNCGYTEKAVVEALGHEFSDKFTIDMPATCTGQGSKSKHCRYCKERSEVTVIEAKGHTYKDEWLVVFESGITGNVKGFGQWVSPPGFDKVHHCFLITSLLQIILYNTYCQIASLKFSSPIRWNILLQRINKRGDNHMSPLTIAVTASLLFSAIIIKRVLAPDHWLTPLR